eukprot:3943570-Alexandrium_andersonii.AAC.1
MDMGTCTRAHPILLAGGDLYFRPKDGVCTPVSPLGAGNSVSLQCLRVARASTPVCLRRESS